MSGREQEVTIREACIEDVPGILRIYNEVVASSTAIYIDDPVTLENREAWLREQQKRGYPVLVADQGSGEIAGFCSLSDWRGAWPGYRFTVEHSVHVGADCRGMGIGRRLVEAIFAYALALGKHVMIGAIDASNDASLKFHGRLGFREVAHFREVGFKFGRWLDLVFMQRILDARAQSPQANGKPPARPVT
jgi:L-amino acid N-acyltransferase YncA